MTGHAYDPLPGQFDFATLVTDDDILGRVGAEVATANHVFDTLRAATLEELEAHEDTVYRLFAALPLALSYRLLRLHDANLRYDAPERELRQPFWRRIRERQDFEFIILQ